ncbi:ACP S-malonyltransferase [Sorangium sp. So ce426]|uniref:ACP S-malonyltransferase n=1 Tax=Sorangium sp. So ce426 TaxID=3133312 RepID=UPI003F5AE24C
MSSIVFMFSGQGSQYYQMGRDLFDCHAGFRARVSELDDMVRGMRGRSLLEHLYAEHKPRGEFCGHLEFSHPAIFVIEYALAQVLIDSGVTPAYLLGASMGEYASCAVAGSMSAEDALEAIFRQIDILEACCTGGGMLAIMHDPALYEEAAILRENSEIAGINYAKHFVVAGSREGLERICEYLRKKNILFQELPAPYAFHSSFMDPAEERYRTFLRTKLLRKPALPLASCFHGRIITEMGDGYLWDVVRKPILLREAIVALEERREDLVYVDLGPSGTLANFVKYNLGKGSSAKVFPVITSFAQDHKNFENVTGQLARGPAEHRPALDAKETRAMRAVVFPGQGSQRKGMGEGVFQQFPELVAKADEILGYSVRQLCLENPDNRLGQTQYTQPALYVVNALTYLRLAQEAGDAPAFVAGHSLGEYNALFAAGAFDFETGLRLVQRRGELMARVEGGGMAAVIGLSEAMVQRVIEENQLQAIDLANINSPRQIVISGRRDAVERARPVFESAGAQSYIQLPVSGAFHSRYMEPAEGELTAFLRQFQYADLRIPVVSNAEAALYTRDRIVELLAKQLTQPVRWTATVQFLLREGMAEFVEAGPGNVLTKLIEKIRKEPLPPAASEREPLPLVAPEREPARPAAQALAMARHEAPKATNGAALAAEAAPAERGTPERVAPMPVDGKAAPGRPARAATLRWLGRASALGDAAFKREYGVRHAYAAGGLPRGITSPALVVRLAQRGLLGFLGTGGLTSSELDAALAEIRGHLVEGQPYGASLAWDPSAHEAEEASIDLLLRHGVTNTELVDYLHVTPALVRYRLKGLRAGRGAGVSVQHRVLVRVSRPELAEAFMSPAPERVVKGLLAAGAVTALEAELASKVAMVDDVCLVPDSILNIDTLVLLPVVQSLRDAAGGRFGYSRRVRVGVGAIGTPGAVATAMLHGADFVMTGAINQCTHEARLSDAAKQLLDRAGVQDSECVPAGHAFETGARTQALRKGLFFPARANKLYQLYRQHDAFDQLSARDRHQVEEKIFRRSLQEVYGDVMAALGRRGPQAIEKAERSPKHKMGLIFQRYFEEASMLAARGDEERRVDYQVYCDPSMGGFNHWVKGSALERWEDRHVDVIAETLMDGAAELLGERLRVLTASVAQAAGTRLGLAEERERSPLEARFEETGS